jgi:polyribonucleotide nucleotidyltransferase
MDIKITSITPEIMKIALAQANEGRMHILGKMAEAITESRTEKSEYAPSIESFMIDKEKIRDVIGTGGKVIREIQETTSTEISIEDDGKVVISGVGAENISKAVEWVKGIVAEAEIGKSYTGEVVKVVDFGAFVKILPNVEGLVHVSEIAPVRIGHAEDIIHEGAMLNVKCIGIEAGKVKISMKDIDQTDADIITKLAEAIENGGTPRREREDGDRDNRGRGRNDRGGRGGRDSRRPRRD